MSFYDQLGVKRDASHAEIRKAYRRKVRKAHPDAGGNAEDFLALQLAYSVLSDPGKREHYNSTGEAPKDGPNPFGEVAALMVQLVKAHSVTSTDLVESARQKIQTASKDTVKAMVAGEQEIGRFREAALRISHPLENHLRQAILNHVVELERGQAALKERAELLEQCLRVLDGYTYRVDPKDVNPWWQQTSLLATRKGATLGA